MRTLTEQLSQYADYHRDPRNIATHFVGIPMIVIAIAILLSRPGVELFGITVTPALLLVIGSAIFYFMLDKMFGVIMTTLFTLTLWLAHQLASGSTTLYLTSGIGLFVVGWVFQFVGHFYEGKKPAFVDDLVGLIVGPLFVVAEVVFFLGLRSEIHAEVTRRSGPVRMRESTTA